MSERTLSRRQFLWSTAKVGIALTLASSPWPPTALVHAEEHAAIQVPYGLDVWKLPEVQKYLLAGRGSLWVAGRFLNLFRNNLLFENLPASLQLKYQFAGAQYKSLPAARGLWESVPTPVRAAGPEAVWKFHKGKDWSHIVPRSVGGPATADNGVWWSSIRNKSLGANEMSAADLADARAALRSEAIRYTIRLTLNGMVKGAIIGVIAGALLACLESGLEYAEGKITWAQMVDKVVKASIFAGMGGMVITGLIIGISLLFPFMIPIFTAVIFALQGVSLLFLGRHLVELAQGWWEVLDGAGKLADFVDILRNAQNAMRQVYNQLREKGAGTVLGWLETLAKRVGVDNVWEWFATNTQVVVEKVSEFTGSLADWDDLLEIDASAIGETIARVAADEFEEAISTTEGLLESISGYQENAHRENPRSALAV